MLPKRTLKERWESEEFNAKLLMEVFEKRFSKICDVLQEINEKLDFKV